MRVKHIVELPASVNPHVGIEQPLREIVASVDGCAVREAHVLCCNALCVERTNDKNRVNGVQSLQQTKTEQKTNENRNCDAP